MVKTAYVGVPCQIQALRKVQAYSKELKQDWIQGLGLQIGLFCRENWAYTCFRALVEDDYGVKLSEIEKFDIKKNKIIGLKNGEKEVNIPIPMAKPFVRVGCQVCLDFTAELADISVGAVGSPPDMSTVIVRTKKGMELLKKAEEKGYVKVKPIEDVKPGMGLVHRIHDDKKNENREEALKRTEAGFKVRHIPSLGDNNLSRYAEAARDKKFADLERDVIDVGSCISCGTCATVAPEDIELLEERPRLKRDNESDETWKAYLACPRTSLPALALEEMFLKDDGLQKDKVGSYLDIFAVKATGKEGLENWQDGGAVNAMLSLAMKEGMIDDVVGVKKDDEWHPNPSRARDIEELVKTAGTVYSYSTNIPLLRED